ncbi:polysaccharide deacetylase family protein [Polyangium sorediatum]|uniref:Polysaccharide deacetylase family protein n=1 Tax=Polyangium sorediatum TaxID=889274 RepID=A0ABT6P8B9_9BACT|nr:polysaccharide deacetylase family protein [Polyangium sorediatum]MDI1436864.1 polysaccharide deacetylase family protein [Polyangium sorediatum]
MSRLVVLMYHALYEGEREFFAIDAADRPYAVSVSAFEAQLDILARRGLPVADPAVLPRKLDREERIVLTFDDGHASTYRHVLPRLLRRDLRAAVFVTSDFIGHRPGFCGWREVREMAERGMLIGSHGRTHRFLDDLPEEAARAELRDSKATIEDHVGGVVEQASFPGGRFRPCDVEAGILEGYRVFHTSRAGAHRAGRLPEGVLLCRIAVRQGTSAGEFEALASASPGWLLRARALGGAKAAVRWALGNGRYHALYERLAGGAG